MNINSPYPQFAPNSNAQNALLNIDDNQPAYLSDCTNVYLSTSGGGGGDYYPSPQDACYYCEDTIINNLNPNGSGYQYGGWCSTAPTTGDAGSGYVSDCANYYFANPANQGDQSSPAAACQSCTNIENVILTSNNGYAQSGTCSALQAIPTTTAATTENFMLFSKGSNNGIFIVIAILLLCVALFFTFRHFKGK